MLPTYDDDAPTVHVECKTCGDTGVKATFIKPNGKMGKIHCECGIRRRPKTLRLVKVERWACGWSTASGRCIRFHCQKSGPCEGYAGDPANG